MQSVFPAADANDIADATGDGADDDVGDDAEEQSPPLPAADDGAASATGGHYDREGDDGNFF